jgi:RecB family exonuclease
MPKVLKSSLQQTEKSSTSESKFPVAHYSASSMTKFSTNPLLFKIQYINLDRFDTAQGISGVIGTAFHQAMEVYSGGSDTLIPTSEAEAIEYGLKSGMDFLEKYNDGFINWSKTVPNKQKAFDRLSFAFTSYVQAIPYSAEKIISVEEELIEQIDVEWRGQKLALPVKLKGRLDKILREDGKLKVIDYKTCAKFSDPEKIDGKKILQAVVYYLLAYAKYKEEPYSVTFQEVKLTKNDDGSSQVREYEIIFAENELYFDFFFRFYEDMTRALNGEQVYIPNVETLYDNEVSIVSYIHRLDVTEEAAKLMKKHKVTNVTDLLKKQIQSAGNMRKLMKAVEENFVSAKNIDYSKMANDQKIQTKMLEHGMMLQFDSLVEGATVDLYRFTPSMGLKMSRLEAYAADIEQVLGIAGIRILAPIKGTSFVGFEVPRKTRTFPALPEGNGFDIAVGQTIMGEARRFDIRTAPHVLIAGASGSGKSICLSSFIRQFSRIPNAQIHLFDPKMVELAQHQGDPNVVEYECEIMKINDALGSLVEEMNDRYRALAKAKVRSIEQISTMPYKFVVIDEFGDLIAARYVHVETVKTGKIFERGSRAGEEETKTTERNISDEIENKILILAQKARAAGIHVVIATQRPSTDVIKGTIKANFPTKVVFKTAKAIDSQIVLDEDGAEKLAGKGDMLFAGNDGIERLQGYNI